MELTATLTFIISLTASLLFGFLVKFLYRGCWKPILIQRKMRSQGINGPSYKFLHGNTKEILNIKKLTDQKPMEGLDNHLVGPKVQPHIFSWISTYGKTFVYWNGTKPEFVITDHEILKEVMNDKSGAFPKDDVEGYFKILLGDGLVVSKGEKWVKMRKLANHVFHAESLRDMIPAMVESVDLMLERWKQYEEKELEIFEEFKLLTSDIISKTAFGSSYVEGKDIFQMLRKLIAITARNEHKIQLPIFKTRDKVESEMIDQMMRDSIMELVRKREKEAEGKQRTFGNDFLGSLMKANHSVDEGYKVTIEDIIDEFKTFYIAGHETTTGLLAWSVFLLAVHTEWQEKAREESFKLFDRKNPDSDGLSRMKTIIMIINETLRLYPPIVSLIRKSKNEASLGKIKIPGKMRLNFHVLSIHNDTQIWGEDAHLFKPERFSKGVAKATNNNPMMFIPFGLGPRSCVGSTFAINETKIALSMILQRYSFTLSPMYIHSPCLVLTISPKFGIPVFIHRV